MMSVFRQKFTRMLVLSLMISGSISARSAVLDAPLPLESQPFGALTLVHEIDTGVTAPNYQDPAAASSTRAVLGRTARVMTVTDTAKVMAWRIGQNKGLIAGRAYVLEVEYPDDVPRAIFITNRGADFNRGFATGTAIGDTRKTYTPSTLESINYPQKGTWKSYRQLFVLHERFATHVNGGRDHECADRSLLPADGFDVVIYQTYDRSDPRSNGVAIGKIKLWQVDTLPSQIASPLNKPPSSLPQRHLYWREEMADEAISASVQVRRAFNDPLAWFDAKMTLATALGFDTFSKDLMEWGHNQGFDAGDPAWINNAGAPITNIWSQLVTRAGQRGLNVLPYFEYGGSIGGNCNGGACDRTSYKSLGLQRRTKKLFATDTDRNYSDVWWTEDYSSDLTDPDLTTDLRRLIDVTIGANANKANVLGMWLRLRQAKLPISFAPETIARYNADNPTALRTLTQLRTDVASRSTYYQWWHKKRRDLLTSSRDYIRQQLAGTNNAAEVHLTAYAQEPLPGAFLSTADSDTAMVKLVSDDPAWWTSYANALVGGDQWFKYQWYATTPADAQTKRIHSAGLKKTWPIAYNREETHGTPPADPENYSAVSGAAVTMPFGTGLFSVNDAATFSDFTNGAGGQTLTRFFALNEDNGYSFDAGTGCTQRRTLNQDDAFQSKVGYLAVAVDREGPYSMIQEARALANGNPHNIGYLESSSFSRGFPEYVRRFNSALLSLPALPAATAANAVSDAEVVVRTIATPSADTYFAVINTSLNDKTAVMVTLPGASSVNDLLAKTTLASNQLRFDMYPGEVRTFKSITSTAAPIISGKIGPSGSVASALAGVSLCTSDGGVTCAAPDGLGNYSCTVNQPGWSGSIHPRVAGRWIPAQTFSNVTANTTRDIGASAVNAQCNLDIDGNGLLEAERDGVAIVRRMLGLSQNTMTGLAGTCAQITTAASLYANADPANFNINGGSVRATTDGLMIYRAMRGQSGTALTNRANDINADVAGWLAAQCNGALSGGVIVTPPAGDTTPPTVSLESSSATVTAVGSITLTATAADNVGVARVDFYEGTTLLTSDAAAPFTHSVSLTSSDNGTRSYTARAFDAANNQTTSSAVQVSVNIVVPSASIALSANPTSVTSGQSSTLTATPTVNAASVTSVDFLANNSVVGTANSAPYTLAVSPTSTTTYTARVNTSAGGLTATSGAISVTLIQGNAPTLSATAASATQVNLSWSAVSNATGYQLERATQSGRFVLHATLPMNTLSFIDESKNSVTGSSPNFTVVNNIVTEGTRYRYRVRAATATGVSGWGVASLTTAGATLSGIQQEPIEFRYSKPLSDASYEYKPMESLFALVYLPPSYSDAANANRDYPVVIFRHGLGQFGGSQSRANLPKLYASDASGTPPYKVATDANFRPDVIVVSPQLPWNFDETSDTEVTLMAGLRDYLTTHYRTAADAFNITGLSAGTSPVVIHATRGARPLASWSVVSNQGWSNATTAVGFARAAQIPSWHASNLGSGGDAATQNTLVQTLVANGGALASNGGKIQNFYFCSSPTVVTGDLSATCSSGGGHNAWTKAYTLDNTVQNPSYWQWVAQQRVPAQ